MAISKLIYFFVVLPIVLFKPGAFMPHKEMRESSRTLSSPTISAVLLECPKLQKRASKPDCEPELMVRIRVSSTFQIDSLDKFLLLDEIYDQKRQTKAKLMAPYLIEITRGEPVLMYPLQFAKSIRCDTCGHKNGNNSVTEGNCEHQPFAPMRLPESNLAAHPLLVEPKASAKQLQQLRSARGKEQLQEKPKQQHHDSEETLEKNHPGQKPIGETEPKPKFSTGIVEPSKSSGNLEQRFPSRHMSVYDANDNGAAYGAKHDFHKHDEPKLNDDILTRRGTENGFQMQSSSNKDWKTEKTLASSNNADELIENENLFREAEKKSEEARLDTVDALKRIHAHPVGSLMDTKSFGSAEKPRIIDLKTGDAKRFTANIDADSVTKSGQGRTYKSKMKQNSFGEYTNGGDVCKTPLHQNLQSPSLKKGGPQLIDVQDNLKRLSEGIRGPIYSQRQGAKYASKSSMESGIPFAERPAQQSRYIWQEGDYANNPSYEKFEDFENIEAGDDDSNNGGVSGSDENYDSGVDTSAPSTSVIESKSNKAKIDGIASADSDMSDEFYLNTLSYPKEKDPYIRNDYYKKIGRNGGIHDQNNKIKRINSIHDGKKVSLTRSEDVKTRTPPVYKSGATISGRNKQCTVYDYNARRTPSERERYEKSSKLKTFYKNGSNTGENFSDKSAIAGKKVRSNDAVVGGGVVETSGQYTGKDGVIPAFPLNGYPGYVRFKGLSPYTVTSPHQSYFKFLENVPQDLIPEKPPFAEEISDPNLTVEDKINLLEALQVRDEPVDVFRKLENELDSTVIINDLSNHDKKKTLQKRSFMVYDDLSVRDTDDYYLDQVEHFDVPISDSLLTGVETAACKSCNGKKCQPNTMDGKGCFCDREGRNCKCRPNLDKKIRSVSDAWYSVFNMSAPLQFLTTRIGIYRKRHGAWWRTAPSITLTSLSGIYVSGNLSILFSSHVDIIQLKRPLKLENHKLLVPNDREDTASLLSTAYASAKPADILAMDSGKFDLNVIPNSQAFDNKNGAYTNLCHDAITAAEHRRKRRSHSSSDSIISVGDLGYFPGSMNVLEKCPSDPEHLCLNMLDDEVPAFTVKIKQPFVENALIYNDKYKVRIASVISDATTKGALQVAVIVVNEDLVAREFAICISNCPMTCGAKTTVKKELAPRVGETISFLLPLEGSKDSKFHCTVEVKSPDQKVISGRKFIVEPTARCLCIWDCECHCIQGLISHDDYNMCHKLDEYEDYSAGFIEGEGGELRSTLTGWRWFWWRMNNYALTLLLFMLFLGFLKAFLGALGLRSIDRCGYDYIQPLQKYDYSSRCRRFFINKVFFLVLPFIFCCKCFTPTEEDLLVASTEWQCSLLQHDASEDSSGEDAGGGSGRWKPFSRYRHGEGNNNDDDDDEETILSQRFESREGLEVSQSRFSEYLMDSNYNYDENEEERDTNYVLQALSESRESIKKLLISHCSEDLDPHNRQSKDADEIVRKLVAAKIVYRTFNKPLLNVDVPAGQKYSVRGYFAPSIGAGYQYFTPSPLNQQPRMAANETVPQSPILLNPDDFTRNYANKLEVLQAGDLSVNPPKDAPCINCANGSQLMITTGLGTSPLPSTPTMTTDTPADRQPVPANDGVARNDRTDDANNGSNLMAKQKDSH